MTDELIGKIRAVDPAVHMPPDAHAVREATRERILQSSPDAPARGSRAKHSPTRARRGLAIAMASALLVLAVPAAGAWAYFTYFTGSDTAMEEFHAAQKDIELPAGAQWAEPNLPDDAVYGSKTGLIAAVSQAMRAWFQEWIAAHEAGDAARQQAAIVAVENLIALAPVHREGDPEEAGGFDEGSMRYFNDIVNQARQGDFSGIEDYLSVNP